MAANFPTLALSRLWSDDPWSLVTSPRPCSSLLPLAGHIGNVSGWERRGVAASLAAVAYGSHRTPREKVARPKARPKARQIPGPRNAKVLLNNLVSKTLRRSLLAGDVVYDVTLADDTWRANVRIYGLEEDQPLKFSGFGSTEKEAELRAAEAALAKLPPAPFVEPRYPKPQDAAAWVVEQLDAAEAVEVDSTMADVLPTIAHVAAQLEVEASFNLEEEPCRVVLMKKPLISWAPEEVRSILVSRKTEGGKLAAAMRARLLGEGEGRSSRSYECLELKMAGKSACREAAIATKILQRFFPEEMGISFHARFEQFEGYRAMGLVLVVLKTKKEFGKEAARSRRYTIYC